MNLQQNMHYLVNNGNGTFSDASVVSGLSKITGGLHIMQTDYNNDGLRDIFVTRRRLENGKRARAEFIIAK